MKLIVNMCIMAENKFIKFSKHPLLNSYLTLDTSKSVIYLVNVSQIVSVSYTLTHHNGYSEEDISYLILKTISGEIELYREDADFVFKQIIERVDF